MNEKDIDGRQLSNSHAKTVSQQVDSIRNNITTYRNSWKEELQKVEAEHDLLELSEKLSAICKEADA